MIIVGELINSTRKKIKEAMQNKDAEYIRDLAIKQDKAGADFIDVNAGAFVTEEMENLEWAINEVQGVTKKPLAIDSPRGEAMAMGLKMHKNGKPMFNSITRESDRWDQLFSLAASFFERISLTILRVSLILLSASTNFSKISLVVSL